MKWTTEDAPDLQRGASAGHIASPAESTKRRQYPRRSVISRAIAAARENGIEVNQIEIGPNGSVRVTAMPLQNPAEDDVFDRWDKAGKL